MVSARVTGIDEAHRTWASFRAPPSTRARRSLPDNPSNVLTACSMVTAARPSPARATNVIRPRVISDRIPRSQKLLKQTLTSLSTRSLMPYKLSHPEGAAKNIDPVVGLLSELCLTRLELGLGQPRVL